MIRSTGHHVHRAAAPESSRGSTPAAGEHQIGPVAHGVAPDPTRPTGNPVPQPGAPSCYAIGATVSCCLNGSDHSVPGSVRLDAGVTQGPIGGRNGRRALGKHRPTHCCHPRNRASMSPREVLHPTGLQTPRAGRKRRPRSPSPATRNSPNETRFKMPRNIARGGRRRACNHEGRCRPLRAKRNPRTAAQRQPSSDWRSTQLRNWRAHQTSNDVSVSWRSAPVSSAKRSSR